MFCEFLCIDLWTISNVRNKEITRKIYTAMRICILPVLLIISFICISCKPERNEDIFAKSESLLETDPDSALSVLTTILYPEELNKEEYNRYALLKIQADYKSYRDITTDSTILSVRDYYQEKEDTYNIALSLYYCGCYYQECGNKESAMNNYMLARDYADRTENSNLKGLIRNAIGVLLLEQFDSEEAMAYFHKSATFYKQAGNLKNEAISYIQIGNCFQYSGEPDSALIYYSNSLRIVDSLEYNKEQSLVRQSIGVLYFGQDESTKAIQYLKEALKYEANLDNRFKICNMLTELYSLNNQKDSANMYVNYLLQQKEEIEDIYVRANLYRILSDIDERQGEYLKALENQKVYAENLSSIIDLNADKKLLDIKRKYDYEKIRLENVQLELDRTRHLIFLIVGLLIMLVTGFIFYRRYKLNKDKLSDLEAKVLQLKCMADSYDKRENTFRSYLLQHFQVLKKATSLEIYVKEGVNRKDEFWLKKINEIIYGKNTMDWNVLYDVMNELHNNFFTNLKKHYPQLNDTEFRIICLTYAKFSSEEIAIILGISLNTVNTKRSAIRKKLGIEAFGNLSEFLEERLNK